MTAPLRLYREGASVRQEPAIGRNSREPLSDDRLTATEKYVLCVMTLMAGNKFPRLDATNERIAREAMVTAQGPANPARLVEYEYARHEKDPSRKTGPWITTFLFEYDPAFSLASNLNPVQQSPGGTAVPPPGGTAVPPPFRGEFLPLFLPPNLVRSCRKERIRRAS